MEIIEKNELIVDIIDRMDKSSKHANTFDFNETNFLLKILRRHDTYPFKQNSDVYIEKQIINLLSRDYININNINNINQNRQNILMLYLAISNPDLEVIDILIEGGININHIDDRGQTALIIYVNNTNVNYQIVNRLIEAGININARDNKKRLAFNIYIRNKNIDYRIVDCLMKVNTTIIIHKYFSILNDKVKSVQILIDKKININIPDEYHRNLLHHVVLSNKYIDSFEQEKVLRLIL